MEETKGKKQEAQTKHPSGDPRYNLIDRVLKRFQFQQDALIEVLHTAQESFGYLDKEMLTYIATQLKLPLSWVYGVATFYHFFSLKPRGEHTCTVCLGTACYVKRSAEVVAKLTEEFNVEPGYTTEDGKMTLITARCLGSCGLAPVVVVDDTFLGQQTPESAVAKVRELIAGERKSEAVPQAETAS